MAADPPDRQRVERARASLQRQLEGADGLVGVGIASGPGGGVELLVLVRSPGCAAARRAPGAWLGCPVRVEVSGTPRRQD